MTKPDLPPEDRVGGDETSDEADDERGSAA